jgi:HK97 family phage portal protein
MMSAFSMRMALMANALLHGNGYIEIERDGANRAVALHVLPHWTVSVYEALNRDRLYYKVVRRNGTIEDLDGSDVIDIPCLALDGVAGLSPISQHRQAIGLGLAAEAAGASFFGNGSRPSGYLSSSRVLTQTEKDNLAERWHAKFGGARNQGKVPIIGGDLKWNQLSINPADTQYMDTRKFQAIDVARSFRVPGILIGIEDAKAYSGIEMVLISFGKFTLAPWLEAIEQEFNRKLFPNRDDLYCKLDMRGLMRGDAKARAEYYKTLWACGGVTQNEIRTWEELEPMDGDDRLWVQQGFMPLDKADEILAKQNGGKQRPSGSDEPFADPNQSPTGDDGQASRAMHTRWLADVCARVGKWERREAARIAEAFCPVFRSLAADLGGKAEPTEYCIELAGQFVPTDTTFAQRAIERFAQEQR